MAKLADRAGIIKRLGPEANVLRRITKVDGSLNFTDAAKTLQLLPLFNGSFQIGQDLRLQALRVFPPLFRGVIEAAHQ